MLAVLLLQIDPSHDLANQLIALVTNAVENHQWGTLIVTVVTVIIALVSRFALKRKTAPTTQSPTQNPTEKK